MKTTGNPSEYYSPDWEETTEQTGHSFGMRRASDAEMSPTERVSRRLDRSRSNRVGDCNVMSLFEVRDKRTGQRDCHLAWVFTELCRLRVSVAAFSEVRRPESVGIPTTGPAVHRGNLKEWF